MTPEEIIETVGYVPAMSLCRARKADTLAELRREAQLFADSLPKRSTKQRAWGSTRPEWLRFVAAYDALATVTPEQIWAASTEEQRYANETPFDRMDRLARARRQERAAQRQTHS